MISLKQLNYALAVEKTRHFKRAAELCSVSQSALSTAIAELENQLGLQIFERDNKRVLVTAVGEQVLRQARSIKLGVEDMESIALQFKAPLATPMRIGMIPTIAPYLLPKILPAIHQQYPQFTFSIVEDQSQPLIDMVRDGDIDTAVLALPYPVEGLHAFEFWQENFFLITHSEDRYATLDHVGSAEISQSHLLLLREGHCLKEHALDACNLKAESANQSLSGSTLNTLVQLVAAGMGSTLVPAMAVEPLLKMHENLRAIPLNEKGPHRRIAFVTRLNYAGVANVELLMALSRQQLAG